TGVHSSRIEKEIPLEYEKICDECRKGDPKERPNIHEVLNKLHSLEDTSTIIPDIVNSDVNIADSKLLGLTFDALGIENYYNNNNTGIENGSSNNDPGTENSDGNNDFVQYSELFVPLITLLVNVVRNELNSGIMTNKYLKECIQEHMDSKQQSLEILFDYLNKHSQKEPNFSVILGLFYQLGVGIQEDFGEAYTQYLYAASKNNDIGQYLLGCCYESGRGTLELESEAFNCYKRSSEMGAYELGKGVNKNTDEAVTWYNEASNQGNKEASTRLKALQQKQNRRH
ncbi:5621_t:CDS:2, partial [Acaulospora morrowiae]